MRRSLPTTILGLLVVCGGSDGKHRTWPSTVRGDHGLCQIGWNRGLTIKIARDLRHMKFACANLKFRPLQN